MEEIVLWGAGVAGEKFYCMYKSRFEIKYVIDRSANRFFHGVRVYGIEEITTGRIKDYFIIMATETRKVYHEIAKQLEKLGLIEFENYIPVGLIDKELAVLYGNCHMIKLEKYLQRQPEFSRRYYTRIHYVADLNENDRFPNDLELKYCKLLISQDIQKIIYFPYQGLKKLKGKQKTVQVYQNS